MYSNAVDGQIVFYYTHKGLFEDVQHQSAFMCKNIVSKEGADLSERYTITDDESPMFELCLAETVPDIYDILKPITHGIEDAVTATMSSSDLHDLIGTTVDDNTYVVFCVQDNEAYNPNTVKLVDSALRSTLEQGVLSNFYVRVTHPDLTQVSSTMYAGQGQALSRRITELRKKSKL